MLVEPFDWVLYFDYLLLYFSIRQRWQQVEECVKLDEQLVSEKEDQHLHLNGNRRVQRDVGEEGAQRGGNGELLDDFRQRAVGKLLGEGACHTVHNKEELNPRSE